MLLTPYPHWRSSICCCWANSIFRRRLHAFILHTHTYTLYMYDLFNLYFYYFFLIFGFSRVETGGEEGNYALARVMIVCVLQLDICTPFDIPQETHNTHTHTCTHKFISRHAHSSKCNRPLQQGLHYVFIVPYIACATNVFCITCEYIQYI